MLTVTTTENKERATSNGAKKNCPKRKNKIGSRSSRKQGF